MERWCWSFQVLELNRHGCVNLVRAFFPLSECKCAGMCQVRFRVTGLSSNPVSLFLKISHRVNADSARKESWEKNYLCLGREEPSLRGFDWILTQFRVCCWYRSLLSGRKSYWMWEELRSRSRCCWGKYDSKTNAVAHLETNRLLLRYHMETDRSSHLIGWAPCFSGGECMLQQLFWHCLEPFS